MIRRAAFSIAVVGVLLAGCGVGNDASPRDIGPNEQPFPLVPTSVAGSPTGGQKVYLVGTDGVHLVASARGELSRDDLLRALLLGATKQDNDLGLQTRIPIGATLDHTSLAQGILTLFIKLPSGTSFEGADARQAYGQLVYTASDRSDVTGVLFDINDQAVHPFDADGKRLSGPANRLNYAAFAPLGLGPDVKTPGGVATTTTALPVTNPPTTTTTTTTTTTSTTSTVPTSGAGTTGS